MAWVKHSHNMYCLCTHCTSVMSPMGNIKFELRWLSKISCVSDCSCFHLLAVNIVHESIFSLYDTIYIACLLFFCRPWNTCIRVILSRPDFHQRFVRTRDKWLDDDEFLESGDTRLPLDLLASQEVEAIFTQHVNTLIAEVKRQE